MKAVKNQIKEGRFSNWSLGRATAFRAAARFYPKDSAFWRGLMRDSARDAVKDAKFYISMGLAK
jgi:hypothetical protein